MIRIKANNSKGFYEYELGGVLDLNYISSKTRRGRVQEKGRISPTLCSENPELCRIEESEMGYRIRKLTPLECWRLMDFTDTDFNKAKEVCSDTQLYKQSGNSIVVNCLVAILGQVFEGKENIYREKNIT